MCECLSVCICAWEGQYVSCWEQNSILSVSWGISTPYIFLRHTLSLIIGHIDFARLDNEKTLSFLFSLSPQWWLKSICCQMQNLIRILRIVTHHRLSHLPRLCCCFCCCCCLFVFMCYFFLLLFFSSHFQALLVWLDLILGNSDQTLELGF